MPDSPADLLIALLGLVLLAPWIAYCISVIRRRWTLHRHRPDPRVTQSEQLFRRGDTAGAIAELDEVIRTGSLQGIGSALVLRARIRLEIGELDAALKDVDEALSLGLKNSHLLTYARGLRGVILAKSGETEGALAACDEAVQAAPDSATAHFCRATVHFDAGELQEAMADALRSVQIDPRDDRSWTILGMARHRLGDLEGAIAAFDEAVRVIPNASSALANRALTRLAAGDPEAACDDAERARALSPTSADVIANCGRIWHHRGETAKAIQRYEEALVLDQHNELACNNLAWLLATNPNALLRDGRRALQLATTACDQSRWQLADMIGTLSAAYAEQGELEDARKLLLRAIELERGGQNARTRGRMLTCFERGQAFRTRPAVGGTAADHVCRTAWYLHERDLDRAVAESEAAMQASPDDSEVLSQRAALLHSMGRNTEAKLCLERAIELDPQDDLAQNNLAWLLATTDDEAIRDGNAAVSYATKACRLTAWQYFEWLDTLAAAFAAAGDFPSAVEWQRRAIELAPASETPPLKTHLELYEAGRAVRQSQSSARS